MHDAVLDFYKNYGVNPGRTGCDLALEAEMIHETRKKFSAFFNPSLAAAGKTKTPTASSSRRTPR